MARLKKPFVVAGINVRNIAKSAKTAGFNVVAITKYCDEDLKIYADKVFGFNSIEDGIKMVIEISQYYNSPVVLSTGFEKFSDYISKKVEVIGRFNIQAIDKLKFYKKLEKSGIPYPEVFGVVSLKIFPRMPLKTSLKIIDYSKGYVCNTINNTEEYNKLFQKIHKKTNKKEILLKPRIGGGGIGIIKVGISKPEPVFKSGNKLSKYKNYNTSKICNRNEYLREYLIQKFIKGHTISAIILADSSKTYVASINEVLSGWKCMNAQGFAYSGNITPFSNSSFINSASFSTPLFKHSSAEKARIIKKVEEIAKDVAEIFDVVGCAGIDMIVDEQDVYVLELNPRIPGSLDSFELSYDENLFLLHLISSDFKTHFQISKHNRAKNMEKLGSLKPKRFACRAVYYSPNILKAYLPSTHPFYADIPKKGEMFDVGSPVASIISTGNSRKEVVNLTIERKKILEKNYLKICKKEE